jgi:phosphate transport system substrate-binding protein
MMKKFLWVSMMVVLLVLTGFAAGVPQVAAIEGIHYDGSSQIYWAFVKDTAENFTKETGIKVVAEDRKTQDAVPSLISGRCNVGGLARKLKLAEKSQAQDLMEVLIARDYMAVFVPRDSKVENLTVQDLKKVFSGQTTDWKDIGGTPGAIQVVIPQIKTACTVNFREQVMGDDPFAKDTLITETAGAVLEAAKGKPAISYISFGAVSKTNDFKVLKIEGKNPGTPGYPLVQEMYFATKGQPEGDVKKYIEFFLKGSGRGLLEKAGLFPPQ